MNDIVTCKHVIDHEPYSFVNLCSLLISVIVKGIQGLHIAHIRLIMLFIKLQYDKLLILM